MTGNCQKCNGWKPIPGTTWFDDGHVCHCYEMQFPKLLLNLKPENLYEIEISSLKAEVNRVKTEKIVELCVCVNGNNPLPDCPCVLCTVRRADARNETLRARIAELEDFIGNAWYFNTETLAEAEKLLSPESQKQPEAKKVKE